MAQNEFDKLSAQIKAANGDVQAFEEAFKKLTGPGKQMDDLLKSMRTHLKGLEVEADNLGSSFGDLVTTLKNIVSEIGRGDSATKDATKAYRGLVSVAQKMQYEEQDIYSYNVKQLKNYESQAKALQTNLDNARDRMSNEEKLEVFGKNHEELLANQGGIVDDLLKKVNKRLESEKKVEKTFGATGALIEGSSKLLSTMGFGHLSSELSELNDKLKSDLRDELKNSEGAANKLALGFKYMGKGLAGSAKIFADGLTDPLFIIGKIFDTYLEINKASVEVERLTGQNAVNLASINTSYATAKDILETILELTKQTGRNAQNIFSKDVLVQAAELKTTMGLTGEEAGGIAIMAQTSNKSVEDITKSVVATTSAFNGANRSAVSQGQVLRDVANTADSIKLSLGNNDVAITKAASAARRLGMDLERVDQIASSLLNFEDSISNELEAELLTGKQLNLEKARELALNNDLAGVGKELFKNSADIHEFGKMNRIQQESYAAALGVTRDELAKMAYQRALDAGMTEEQAEAATKVKAEDMKRLEIQQNFAKALEKIAGALAPILDVVGSILSMPLVPYLLLGAAAVYKIGGGIISSAKGMGSLIKGAKDFVTNLNMKGVMEFFGKIKDSFNVGLGKKAEETVKDAVVGKAEDAAAGLADKAKDKAGELVEGKVDDLADKAMGAGENVPEKTGKGVGGLAESIQKIKPSQLLAGGAALLMVAGSVYIFAKAAQEFATVSWEDMAKAGVGLLGLVGALALVGAIMTSGVGAVAILAGAAALVIMAGGLYVLGKALQEVGEGMNLMEPALALVSSIGDKAAGLATVGTSLLGIAAGLREIADAGTGAIPVLQKINALGGGGSAGESTERTIGGVTRSSNEEGTVALAAKMDALIAAVKAGGDVYLDSNKVGRTQTLGSYKLA